MEVVLVLFTAASVAMMGAAAAVTAATTAALVASVSATVKVAAFLAAAPAAAVDALVPLPRNALTPKKYSTPEQLLLMCFSSLGSPAVAAAALIAAAAVHTLPPLLPRG